MAARAEGAAAARRAALLARADRTGSTKDLDEAVTLFERASKSIPVEHPALVECLSQLGDAYISRFQHTTELTDLDTGIAATERAVDLAGPDNPHRILRAVLNSHRHP